MNSLIINTSNKILHIVLQKGEQVFSVCSSQDAHHNEVLVPLIDKLLKQHKVKISNINRFGVVVGPGSFTGIRVGVATIKAFRDAFNVPAFGINNLDLLFALASAQYSQIEAVAISGSGNTYFVARMVNGVLYKYNRNLSLAELKEIAPTGRVAMFEADKNFEPLVVELDAEITLKCLQESTDTALLPIYYQLSQAEREKLKSGTITIEKATKSNLVRIAELESQVATSPLTENQIADMMANKTYNILTCKFNGQVVGFLILQFTDEANIVSVAVDKDFRNLGIATNLIHAAEKKAKKQKLAALTLEVGSKNIDAYLLYTKLGFIVRRKRKKYYANGDDCFEMVKQV